MSFPRTKAAEARALRSFQEMPADVQAFVSKLYAVRHDRAQLRRVFDENCAGIKVASGAVLADTVRDLPENWIR